MKFIDAPSTVVQPPPVSISDLYDPSNDEPTYPLGVVARLTGLSAHVLRAWERRYGAVRPVRTPGGTRRYRESDVQRLQLLRAAVSAGHSIGEVATASEAELTRRLELRPSAPAPALDPILAALERLDLVESERLLGVQLAALGSGEFVRSVAAPLLREIGRRWESGQLCIASEHLASSTLRSLLGTALRPRAAALLAAPILFTTLQGEQHDLGSVMAAVAASEAGSFPVFVGGNLPVAEIVEAAESVGACAIALGASHMDETSDAQLAALRESLPSDIPIWVGGCAAGALTLPHGVARVADFDELAHKVVLLTERRSPG